MGLCVSWGRVNRYPNMEIDIDPRAREVNFQMSSFSEEYERMKSSQCTIGSLTYTESARSGSDFLKCKTTQREKPRRNSRSVLSPTIPPISHSESESTESVVFLSYDGLNRRSNNRADIGLEVLKAKIHFGADPNSMSTHGERTSLMFSVISGDFGLTKKLVELGVDINETNRFGETALGLAIELKRNEIANYLRSKGAANGVLRL